jgi:hypothetical protein
MGLLIPGVAGVAGVAAGIALAWNAPFGLGARGQLDARDTVIRTQERTIGSYKTANAAWVAAVAQRDARILAQAQTEKESYDKLEKRCSADAVVWYKRGLAVARAAGAVADGTGDAGVGVSDSFRDAWSEGAYSGSGR